MKILIIFFIGLLITPNSLAEKLPIEAFLKRDNYQDMKLSPDGKYLSTLLLRNEKVILIVTDRKTGKIVGGINPGGENELHSFNWVNNTRITYELAEKRSEFDRPIPTGELFAINFDGTESEIIFGYRASDERLGTRIKTKSNSISSHEIVSLLEDDDENILIAEYPWEKRGFEYYDTREKPPTISKLNVYTGTKKKVEFIPFKEATILATRKGDINFVHWSDDKGNYHGSYRKKPESPWIEISEIFNISKNALPIAIDTNGEKIFFEADTGPDELRTIFELELVSNKATSLFSDNSSDIYTWVNDIDTNTPAVGISDPLRVIYHYPANELRSSSWHRILAKAFKGSHVKLLSWTKDGKEIIVFVSSDINAGEYYLFNTETKKADFIHANLMWLDPRNMRPMKTLEVTTRDKRRIPTLLTLPENKNAPLVVLPHGGPHEHDTWGFDPIVQMLANQGYAVLQINFRGSTGYGAAYQRAGYREWGGKMIDDIIDATRSIVDQGLVNADKACIFGISYGAYAAMMSAAKAPELFQCAIGYAGIYDLELLYSMGDIRLNLGGENYLERTVGKDPMQLKALSPTNHAKKITANVMLIHGTEDIRAPIAHAEAMKQALNDEGHKVQWQTYGSAGHGVWNLQDQTKLFTGLVNFLDNNLKN